ncbi:hypothetical protein [Mycolicibacterium gadium]|uniref:Uncharacterized protein n=1 Tax=Mycolicibacterium gadium TaxID=1794 RepID=A0A7I7WTN2_MYCGU|nr:hypothetical protein [Mycolicibacterium gadium]MDG5486219.1 hypothetical protein [Mycolicibacterium gadium]BBZ20087.1 hypothetical protein MGAD_44220 [Mycolicibacterium gadium]
MAEREASGDFDYLIGDLPEAPSESEDSDGDEALLESAPADDYEPARHDHPPGAFDAFDADTWYFEPAPAPWYRGRHVLALWIAAGTAAAALVVSAVLLIVRNPAPDVDTTTPTEAPSTTTAVSTERTTSSEVPPPPPPETSAEPIDPGPAQTVRPQNPPPRSTRPPEIGVTRTPVTRSPISVAPQPRGPR